MSRRYPARNYKRQPQTPDPRMRYDEANEANKLHQKPCKFWKLGKCNWGWGCRFLHGNSVEDDPRRQEYRGPAVDFQQFPRVSVSSPYLNPSTPFHPDDQSRMRPIPLPTVEIVYSPTFEAGAQSPAEQYFTNSINVLKSSGKKLGFSEAKDRLRTIRCDYLIYIETDHAVILPMELQIPHNAIAGCINHHWATQSINLTEQQLELMTIDDIDGLVKRLTGLDKYRETVAEYQNEVLDALYPRTQVNHQKVIQLRTKIYNFFAKLNLANSAVSELPLYSGRREFGRFVDKYHPHQVAAISPSAQKSIVRVICLQLTQLHLCLFRLNSLLGELNNMRELFPVPENFHSNPYADPSFIVGDGSAAMQTEPEAFISSDYTTSFRNGPRPNNQFNPFPRNIFK